MQVKQAKESKPTPKKAKNPKKSPAAKAASKSPKKKGTKRAKSASKTRSGSPAGKKLKKASPAAVGKKKEVRFVYTCNFLGLKRKQILSLIFVAAQCNKM